MIDAIPCAPQLNGKLQHVPVLVSPPRSEEHTSELQSPCNLVCRLLLEKKTTFHPDSLQLAFLSAGQRTNHHPSNIRASTPSSRSILPAKLGSVHLRSIHHAD